MSSTYKSTLRFIMKASYILGVISITLAILLSVINIPVAAAPEMQVQTCEGYDLKQEGEGTEEDHRGYVTIDPGSRHASWGAYEGFEVSAACVKGGSTNDNSQSNGYLTTFGSGDGDFSAGEDQPNISHAAVSFVKKTPTPFPSNTPTNTPVTPTNTPTNTPVTPTNTPTNTPVTPTNTPTNTPVTPTNTPTNTPVTPTNTPTNTPVTPTNTPTPVLETPGTPTATPEDPTPTPVTPTPTNTPTDPPTSTPTEPPTSTPTDPPTETPTPVTPTPEDPTPTPEDPTETPVTPTPEDPTQTPGPTGTPVQDTPTTPTTVVTTAVPTLPVPDVQETPAVLIPVTGADLTPLSPIDSVQKLAFNLGLGLIGLGLVLQGIRRYFG